MDCACLSRQEERILNPGQGIDLELRKGRDRVYKILEESYLVKPHISIERALWFTRSMKETEGELLVLRWAKAMKNIAENITVDIEDGQLIVGRAGGKGRYGLVYPELEGSFLARAMEELPKREVSPFTVSEEDAKIAIEEIAPYWEKNTFVRNYNQALKGVEKAQFMAFRDDDGYEPTYLVSPSAVFRSSLQWVPGYAKAVNKGFKALKDETLERIANLDPDDVVDMTEKRPFLEAMVIVCDAIVLWANRHAVLARKLAKKEMDPVRKNELLTIAANCERVPEYPAETFHQAVQAHWFVSCFSRLEQKTGAVVSNGRIDQFLYPYYKKDIEEGRLTRDEALEILECHWVAMSQYIDLFLAPLGTTFSEGYAHWEATTIGGQTRDGQDATNELSYLILKSKREFPIAYPDLAARVHARSPERFLSEVSETLKEGSGYPKLINDEEVIPNLISKGAPVADAYDYAVSGCSEVRMPDRDTYITPGSWVNVAAALEMVLYNGRVKKFGDTLYGLETGALSELKTWDDFWQAFKKQFEHLLRYAVILQKVADDIRPDQFAHPIATVLHDLCMADCKDIHQNNIKDGVDIGFFDVVGYGTAVDSLSAIKKLIYEDEVITLDELIAAIDNDFEGHELTRARLMKAPCYGNNDPYADSIGKAVDRIALEYTQKHGSKLGINFDLRYVPITSHVPMGKVVAASPNGRKAWTALSDGTSPSHGVDSNGPTAVIASNTASKNYDMKERAARLLNIKLTPKCVANAEGTKRLNSVMRTFCDNKLWHMQFNVINHETLLAAQKDPEKYRGLIVRVAGYSAYFAELSPAMQDDIIRRTAFDSI